MPDIICTIGFSKKSLRKFINLLKEAGVTKLIDTRLNNTSQLSGFAKKNDLAYILELVGIDYEHEEAMAPTDEILKGFKGKEITWIDYEKSYVNLLESRNVQFIASEQILSGNVCYLCSEEKPDYCHRRLLAEYIQLKLTDEIFIRHLV
jgi:uncharacterized protein (DUF488 family)